MKSFVTHDQFDRLKWKIIAIDSERPLRVTRAVRDSEIER
jgi:hypothetical protein